MEKVTFKEVVEKTMIIKYIIKSKTQKIDKVLLLKSLK